MATPCVPHNITDRKEFPYRAKLTAHYRQVRRRLNPSPRPEPKPEPKPQPRIVSIDIKDHGGLVPIPITFIPGLERPEIALVEGMPKILIRDIQERVASHFGFTVEELTNDRRFKRLIWPRHVAIWLCCRLTKWSFPYIGRAFGKRDHTTIMYARNVVQSRWEKDEAVAKEICDIIVAIVTKATRGL